jgi:1-aminocyclopropane-1-carboxylate deaminase/D-cysteine desulfhydrase-like pyridoxal-dependent ACC family enzyme
MQERLQHLKDCLSSIPQAYYPVHSRVHPLRSFNFPGTTCYVKRDDELGFGISGSKIRKYRTLIPFFINKGIQEVVLIGSAYSNHVLSLQQLLLENGVHPTLFVRGDPTRSLVGNSLLTSLFHLPSSIHWFSKTEWSKVETYAFAYAKQQTHPTFVLPEGGVCEEAFAGALTLPLDLQENEKERGFHLNHILIDAGTGFMASALILALHWIKHPTNVHVVLLAEDEAAFLNRLKQCQNMFNRLMQISSSFPENFTLHLPKVTGHFGKTNALLFENIAQLAQKEGFLTDPIYTVKLFMESKHLLSLGHMGDNVLIHHSGGALTLMGFQEQLKKQINPTM